MTLQWCLFTGAGIQKALGVLYKVSNILSWLQTDKKSEEFG